MAAVLHAHRDEADNALKLVKATVTPFPSTLANENILGHLRRPASRDGGSGTPAM
jgi:hypothetical protein